MGDLALREERSVFPARCDPQSHRVSHLDKRACLPDRFYIGNTSVPSLEFVSFTHTHTVEEFYVGLRHPGARCGLR
jgi:hypothetical protein